MHDLINNEFNYQFNYKDQIIYKDLENFLLSLNVPNVNSISTYEEPKEIIINLVKDKNENIIKLNIDEEAIVKYFNLPDEDDKAKEFFTDKNLENNKKKFYEIKHSNSDKKYVFVYDDSRINDNKIMPFLLLIY